VQGTHDIRERGDVFRLQPDRNSKGVIMSQNATTAANVVTARAARATALATKKTAETTLATASTAKLLADAVYQSALEADDRTAK
jgi:hypothetical protein